MKYIMIVILAFFLGMINISVGAGIIYLGLTDNRVWMQALMYACAFSWFTNGGFYARK